MLPKEVDDHVVHALAKVNGPFALVFCDVLTRRIYCGRDRLGRRSLLQKRPGHILTLSSVDDGSASWTEVPADGIYMVDLEQRTNISQADSNIDLPQVVSWQLIGIMPTLNRV